MSQLPHINKSMLNKKKRYDRRGEMTSILIWKLMGK